MSIGKIALHPIIQMSGGLPQGPTQFLNILVLFIIFSAFYSAYSLGNTWHEHRA